MLDEIKRKIDKIENILVGIVPDPKSQVDIITVTMIYKFMDDMDLISLNLPNGKRAFFSVDNDIDYEKYAWSNIMKTSVEAGERAKLFRDGIENIWKNSKLPSLFRGIFKNAFVIVKNPETLNLFLKEMDYFNYRDSEILGDAFEYLLSKMSSQGDAGQFRTPRHIIDMIVEIVDPKKNDTIKDIACGTAGFLISSFLHIIKTNTEAGENILTPKEKERLSNNIVGYDISPDMVKFSKVNLYLHHFNDPQIFEYDTLASTEKWEDKADVMLANPPFMSPSGGIKAHNLFKIKANKSEVLFVDYIIEHLNPKGRAGVIVPEGIIFLNGISYKKLRKDLVAEKFLYAIISLPAGVFQPYSVVKTNILFMDRELAAKTKEVLFIKINNDGFSLGSQRREIKENDIPRTIELLKRYKKAILENESFKLNEEEKYANLVSKENIAKSGDYNLSSDRYVETTEVTNKYSMIRLGDIIKINFGKRITKREKKGTIYPVYGGGGESFKTNDFNRENEYVISRFAMSENCVRFVKGKFWMLDSGGTFSINKEYLNRLDKKFIGNTLLNIQNDIYGCGRGVAQKNLDNDYFYEIKIPIPPIEIQQKIVAELDDYQHIIDGAKSIISEHENKIKAVIEKLWDSPTSLPENSSSDTTKVDETLQLSKDNIVPR